MDHSDLSEAGEAFNQYVLKKAKNAPFNSLTSSLKTMYSEMLIAPVPASLQGVLDRLA